MKPFKTLALLCALSSSILHAQMAEQVYITGKVYTANPLKPWAEAIAVKGDKILAVGDTEQIQNHIGDNTQVHHLTNQLIIPGIVDAHTHPGMVARSLGNLLLPEVDNQQQLLKAVEKLIRDNPDREVIIGGYWENGLFGKTGPHKKLLDAIEPKRPVILYDAWGHSVWVNSAALKQAGVDKHTKDIVPGLAFYQRDEMGEPSGWITESAASVFTNHFAKMTPAIEQSMLAYLQYLQSKGVTTLLDAGNFGLDEKTYQVISRWDKAGKLPVRYNAAYTLFLPQDYPTAIEKLKHLNKQYGSDNFRIDTLKVFLDGVVETRTAYLTEDYKDTPNNQGLSILDQAKLSQLVIDLHNEQLNMHVHAVGNKAIKIMLNAVEDAQHKLKQSLQTRITICHLEVLDDKDFARFKPLGISANFTPHWHAGDGIEYTAAVGKTKADNVMRAQPLITDGVAVSFSSDITDETEWKTERANPFLGMQVAHNKQDIEGGASAPISPPISERLTLTSLIDGYTRHGAYQLDRDNMIGSLEKGKLADFIILNQNLFEINRYDIHKTKPEAVIVKGELVFGNIK